MLSSVGSAEIYELVTVNIKVVSIGNEVVVNSLRKQEVIVADKSACINVGEVCKADIDVGEIIENAKVIGVINLIEHKGCMKCGSRVEPESPPYGCCSNCRMLQLYEFCELKRGAQLLFVNDKKTLDADFFTGLSQGHKNQKIKLIDYVQ